MSDQAVQRGDAAGLSVFRDRSSQTDAFSTALRQFLDSEEVTLMAPLSATLCLTESCTNQEARIAAVPNDKATSSTSSSTDATTAVPGSVLITTDRFLFWAQHGTKSAHDLVVPAECIELHAVAPGSIYLQILQPSESSASLEVTVVPKTTTDQNHIDNVCHEIFEAFSQLVALHPIEPDEEDAGMFGVDDEMIVAAPTEQQEPTPQEREAMLDRLDNLLVVPPELELPDDDNMNEGQFDDAEEHDLL